MPGGVVGITGFAGSFTNVRNPSYVRAIQTSWCWYGPSVPGATPV